MRQFYNMNDCRSRKVLVFFCKKYNRKYFSLQLIFCLKNLKAQTRTKNCENLYTLSNWHILFITLVNL